MNNFIIDFIDTATTEAINEYLTNNNATVVNVFSKLKNVYLVSCEAYPEENVIVSHIINDSLTSITKLDYDIPLNLPTDNQSVVLEDEKNWWKIASMYSPKFDQETMEIPIRGEGVREIGRAHV